MDTLIGKLLEKVDALDPNTYVIFLGDNGTPMYGRLRLDFIDNMYITDVSNASQSQVLTLSEGQKAENIDFRLPPSLPTLPIKGLVLDQLGKPIAKDVHIEVFDLRTGRVVDTPESIMTRESIPSEGAFSITVPAGREYRVRAVKGYFGDDAQQSEAVTIVANERLVPITLKLTKPFRESEDAPTP